MREVAALVEAQTQHGVAGLEQREVSGQIGVGAAVWLHVGVIGAKEFLHALARKVLDLVDHGVAAVIPLPWVALAVLIGQDAPGGFDYLP